jgi:hypothetical protein
MATSIRETESTAVRRGPRVVVHVPEEVQFLLSQVARYLFCTKKELHEAIWHAGLKVHLGLSDEDFEDMVVTSLPRGTAAPTEPKTITAALLGER